MIVRTSTEYATAAHNDTIPKNAAGFASKSLRSHSVATGINDRKNSNPMFAHITAPLIRVVARSR